MKSTSFRPLTSFKTLSVLAFCIGTFLCGCSTKDSSTSAQSAAQTGTSGAAQEPGSASSGSDKGRCVGQSLALADKGEKGECAKPVPEAPVGPSDPKARKFVHDKCNSSSDAACNLECCEEGEFNEDGGKGCKEWGKTNSCTPLTKQ